MMNLVLAIVVLMFGLINQTTAGSDANHNWDYGRRGPDVWRHDYKTCAGLRQSPINIDPNNVQYDSSLKPFIFVNYKRDFRWNVSHNGHTVYVRKIDGSDVSIRGSNLDSEYNLLQFHFHWGNNDYQGSEHLIAMEKYPLEMHLVHQSNSGTLAVLGVLFQLSKEDNPNLYPLMNAISYTNDEQNWREVTMNLSSILPSESEMESYYRYVGSLTTPPCTEGVLWNVFKTFVDISHYQLLSFRTNRVRVNYREPQQIYDRKIFSSFQSAKSLSGKKSSGQSAKSDASRVVKASWPLYAISTATMLILSNFYRLS